jgi:hypothetical protein
MLKSDQSFTYAYFGDKQSATAAVHALLEGGFDSEHIGVLMRDDSDSAEPQEVPLDHKTSMGPGMAIGSLLGVAAGAVALPAAGVIALGGAFAALGGAAVGGAAGTLTGALGGLGVWKDQAAIPSSAFEHGGVLVGTLTSPDRAEAAKASLASAGAREVKLATEAEAQRDLGSTSAAVTQHLGRNVSPDKIARKVFLLTLAYVAAVGGSIWLFIRPL